MGSLFSKGFTPDDLPDLTGKVIVVTGGNAGIGFATIQHLVRRGAKIYMAARNKERADRALERLHASGIGSGEVVWLYTDFSNPELAKKAAESLKEKEERLDAVVNCAALLLVPYAKTSDGIQDVVMVNYLSPFVFIRTLLPILKRTAEEPNSDVRIVHLSSKEHFNAPNDVHFRNVEDFNVEYSDYSLPQYQRYSLSKLMGILFVKELQRRLDAESSPIIVMAVHPGVVNTEGVQKYAHSVGPILSPIYSVIASTFFERPEVGGYAPAFAAVAPVVRAEPRTYRGAYIVPPGMVGKPSRLAESPELAKELWETTEGILRDLGIDLP
ncbi:NAD-P-binding protein [Laetiporus sulphureus 93-53]|uniref:NAD-P-binding protein n=1 Tax=Laetiporus sulphureus 93-53 TaxID=1314785 RepID=A0A165D9P3_9APHY|nr:NAD-P-binding protein [Laetiporus sulphureus 93-53]KZT04392.1 NAD-P-binding protein [Laetiporus sulphureus 93-53]